MPIFETMIFGVLTPALIAGAILLLGWQRAVEGRRLPPVLTAIAFALSAGAAYYLLIGLPAFPPVQAEEWAIMSMMAAAAACVVLALVRAQVILRSVVMAAVFAAAAYVLVAPGNEYLWREIPSLSVAAVIFLAGFGAWVITDLHAERERGAALPFLLMLAMAVNALALMLAGSMKFGQMGVALAAMSGAAWVVTWLVPSLRLSPGWTAPLAAGLTALLTAAGIYAWLPLPAAVMGALAATLPGISGLARKHRPRSLLVTAVESLLILAMGAIAIWLTFQASPSLDPYIY